MQMTLDEDLVAAVDRVVKRLGSSRSAFAREALKSELRRISVVELEARQREGYRRRPVKAAEFSVWEDEQAWVE